MFMHNVGTPSAGTTIASFGSYEGAEAFVDELSDTGFPVDHVSIVGRDVHTIERVTGRLDAWRAAAYGALSGALFGSLLGLIFGGLFADDGWEFLSAWLYWLLIGALFTATIALVSYAMMGGRRNFSSLRGITAGQYDVAVDESVVEQAERWLAEHSTTPAR
jgi:hypothetical protein